MKYERAFWAVTGLGLVLTVWVVWRADRHSSPVEPVQAAATRQEAKPAKRPPLALKTETASSVPNVPQRRPVKVIQTSNKPESALDEDSLQAAADAVPDGEIKARLESLRSGPQTPASQDLQLRLIRRWAGKEPAAAAQWIGRMPEGSMRQDAVGEVAIEWANQNLADAVGWAWQLPDDTERNKGLTAIAYEAARTDPMTSLDVALELPATPARDALVQHAALQWAARSPVAAAVWAGQIKDAALRERVMANVATAWSSSDPVAAAQFAVLLLAPGKTQDDAVIGIVQRWVQKDPEAAAKWVAAFPKGALGETAAENVIQLWPTKRP